MFQSHRGAVSSSKSIAQFGQYAAERPQGRSRGDRGQAPDSGSPDRSRLVHPANLGSNEGSHERTASWDGARCFIPGMRFQRGDTVVIPAEYEGWVQIRYQVNGSPELRKEDGANLIEVPKG
jgi:hypothetical protein